MKFNCDKCQQPLEAQDEMAGERIKCPSCSGDIEIPNAAVPPPYNKNWYYKNGDNSVGPVPDEAIKALVRAGVIGNTTLVRHDGMSEWTTVDQSDIKDHVGAPIPTPPIRPTISLIHRRLLGALVDLSLIVLFSSVYAQIHYNVTEWAWDFHLGVGYVAFSVLWFFLNRSKCVSPGRWIAGVSIHKNGRPLNSYGLLLLRWLLTWGLFGLFMVGLIFIFLTVIGLEGARSYTLWPDMEMSMYKEYNYRPFLFLIPAGVSLIMLIITNGKKGIQDIGCIASTSEAKLPFFKKALAAIIVIVSFSHLYVSFQTKLASRVYMSVLGRYVIEFPDNPEMRINDGIPVIAVNRRIGFMKDSACFRSVYFDQAPPMAQDGNIDWDRLLEQMPLRDRSFVRGYREGNIEGLPYREWVIDQPDDISYVTIVRVIVNRNGYYELAVIGRDLISDSPQAAYFFNSFRLLY